MMESSQPNFSDYLKPGWAISIEGEETGQMAASIVRLEGALLWLDLIRPRVPSPLQRGSQARIKYWDQSAVVYCWTVQVMETEGPENNRVAVVMRGPGITIQRRAHFRLRFAVPMAVTIIEASEDSLQGKHIPNIQTRDISVGGLLFETDRPLEKGDKLEISLFLPFPQSSDLEREPSLQCVNAVGWVVRSEPASESGSGLRAVAVQFLQLEDLQQTNLLTFLADHTQNQP